MAKKQKEQELEFFNIGENWEIRGARRTDYGTFFTLSMPGLSLYNLRIVPAGKKYDAFIGMPEDKGSDGNYYKRFALYLSEDDTAAIIEAVEEELTKNSKKTRGR